MDFVPFVAGVSIGLAVSAPLGPVNALVIRSTLRHGFAAGLVAGAGALAADGVFATLAAFGLRWIEQLVAAYATALAIGGGVLLVLMGLAIARQHFQPSDLSAPPEPPGSGRLWRKFAANFGITITNPGALLGSFAMFGSMGPVLKLSAAPGRAALAIAGVAIGGALWWVVMSYTVNRLKTRLTATMLDRIHRWTGVLVAAFGFALLMNTLG